jgi:nodulation protein E
VTRVAITGIGVISCFGRGMATTLEAVRSGRSGIKLLTSIDASELKCRIGGEVPAEADQGQLRGHDRFTRFALIAAAEAAEAARYNADDIDPDRVGAMIGTGLGGCETVEANYKRLYRDGATRFPPTAIACSMYNAATSAVSTTYRARGVSFAVVSACASSAHAIGLAYQTIRSGQADVMFAGGADAPLVPGIIRAWEAMRVLAIDNEHPARACRPFSADRRGLVLAEGAAVFILESYEHVMKRGAKTVGEIAGFGATSDAGHLTDPSAEGAARAMANAMNDGGLSPRDIGYINAHGTGTPANDVTETRAIKEIFGEHARAIPVSSTKSMHGHAMGASGALEIACSLIALNEGVVPPTINLEKHDPACDLDYVADGARAGHVDIFLSNSFGFGGMNAVLAVRTSVAADLLPTVKH